VGVLIVCRGIPGSGKTTWAMSWVVDDLGARARVNRDDLRAMMHAGCYRGGATEPQVIKAEHAIIRELLGAGVDVVCDDTNLTRYALEGLQRTAMQAGAEFQVQSFLDVPLEVCLDRNAGRPKPVPPDVVREMWEQHVLPLTAGAGS
jgi:predicted kinase